MFTQNTFKVKMQLYEPLLRLCEMLSPVTAVTSLVSTGFKFTVYHMLDVRDADLGLSGARALSEYSGFEADEGKIFEN
jgi:hypothetical protein